jgi:hypothetical protein
MRNMTVLKMPHAQLVKLSPLEPVVMRAGVSRIYLEKDRVMHLNGLPISMHNMYSL